VHLAVIEHHGIDRIMTFDSGFDAFPGITHLLGIHRVGNRFTLAKLPR
jgi:hypothetical protein